MVTTRTAAAKAQATANSPVAQATDPVSHATAAPATQAAPMKKTRAPKKSTVKKEPKEATGKASKATATKNRKKPTTKAPKKSAKVADGEGPSQKKTTVNSQEETPDGSTNENNAAVDAPTVEHRQQEEQRTGDEPDREPSREQTPDPAVRRSTRNSAGKRAKLETSGDFTKSGKGNQKSDDYAKGFGRIPATEGGTLGATSREVSEDLKAMMEENHHTNRSDERDHEAQSGSEEQASVDEELKGRTVKIVKTTVKASKASSKTAKGSVQKSKATVKKTTKVSKAKGGSSNDIGSSSKGPGQKAAEEKGKKSAKKTAK